MSRAGGSAFDLLDTYFVLIIVYTGMNLSFVVWLLRGFFEEIPIELEQSAFAWNEFLFAAILTADHVRTLPVAITGFSTSMGIRWGAFMATAAVGIVPIFILTVLLQRHLVRGLTFGAVK
jgi:multiple sugar transport system permease protein